MVVLIRRCVFFVCKRPKSQNPGKPDFDGLKVEGNLSHIRASGRIVIPGGDRTKTPQLDVALFIIPRI